MILRLPTLDKPWEFINLYSRASPSWLSWNFWDSFFHKKEKKIASLLHYTSWPFRPCFHELLKKICVFNSKSFIVLLHKTILGELTCKCWRFYCSRLSSISCTSLHIWTAKKWIDEYNIKSFIHFLLVLPKRISTGLEMLTKSTFLLTSKLL